MTELASLAERVLARALSLRIAPRMLELRALYATGGGPGPFDDTYMGCMGWALDQLAAAPRTQRTEDEETTILWTDDLVAFEDRLIDLRTRLEVETCSHPGDLRAVP